MPATLALSSSLLAKPGRAADAVSAVRAHQKRFQRLPKEIRISFTARLANEVALRRGREHASLSLPELVVELQRTIHPDRFPSFKLLSSEIPKY